MLPVVQPKLHPQCSVKPAATMMAILTILLLCHAVGHSPNCILTITKNITKCAHVDNGCD